MARSFPAFVPLIAVAILLTACSSSAATPSARASAGGSAVISQPPSPSPVVAALGGGGTASFPGTYRVAFQPAFTFRIGNEVDLDCAPGYQCRGDINVNQPDWLDLEFGNVTGSEFMVNRVDQISDPASPGTVIDTPADVAALILRSPGVAELEAPHTVSVGGLAATQLDVWAHDALRLGPPQGTDGPDYGFPTEHEIRVIILRVHDHRVLITEQIGPENTLRDFPASLVGLQLLVASITWQ